MDVDIGIHPHESNIDVDGWFARQALFFTVVHFFFFRCLKMKIYKTNQQTESFHTNMTNSPPFLGNLTHTTVWKSYIIFVRKAFDRISTIFKKNMAYLTIEGAILSHLQWFSHKNWGLKNKTWVRSHVFFFMDTSHGNTNSRIKIYFKNVILSTLKMLYFLKYSPLFTTNIAFLMDRNWPSKCNISN